MRPVGPAQPPLAATHGGCRQIVVAAVLHSSTVLPTLMRAAPSTKNYPVRAAAAHGGYTHVLPRRTMINIQGARGTAPSPPAVHGGAQARTTPGGTPRRRASQVLVVPAAQPRGGNGHGRGAEVAAPAGTTATSATAAATAVAAAAAVAMRRRHGAVAASMGTGKGGRGEERVGHS